MNTLSHRIRTGTALAALCWLSPATPGWAQTPDPTTLSPQLAEKLLSLGMETQRPQVAPPASVPEVPRVVLRLKGIVLRDSDHGTALIGAEGTALYVLTLDRGSLKTSPRMLDIGGTRLVLEDFSATSLTMRCTDTSREFVIH